MSNSYLQSSPRGFIVVRVVDLCLAAECVTESGASVWGPLTDARVHQDYAAAKMAAQSSRGLVLRWPNGFTGLEVDVPRTLDVYLRAKETADAEL